jgi:hypothetical protein
MDTIFLNHDREGLKSLKIVYKREGVSGVRIFQTSCPVHIKKL